MRELCHYPRVTQLPKHQSQALDSRSPRLKALFLLGYLSVSSEAGEKPDTGEIVKAELQNGENLCSLCLWRHN